jgi:16S rRNA (adenine1518-N6/adenine1519-N6)-dimethyltransferase
VTAPSAKQLLERHGLAPKSSFGQNFLEDRHLVRKLAELCTPDGASVLELGAGLGALTRPLLERAERVIAVERDRDLVPVLSSEFEREIAAGKLALREADAKGIDVAGELGAFPPPRVLCGNLPYNITGPLIEKAVHASALLSRVVFLVQLEVADRLAASAGEEDYGALSVFVQAVYRVERALVIRRGAFYPQPRVDSAVVVFTPHPEPLARETPIFRALVRGAFGQRRKKLRNAWQNIPDRSAEEVASAAERAGIDLDARGETLSVHAFARMSEELER